jgi:hypothetical protein
MEFAVRKVQQRYNWTAEHTAMVEREWHRFLILKSLDEFDQFSPCDDVDALWHQIILNTRYYADYCHNQFHKMIHHDPENAEDQDARKLRLELTLEAYCDRFGEEPVGAIWNDQQEAEVEEEDVAEDEDVEDHYAVEYQPPPLPVSPFEIQVFIKTIEGPTYPIQISPVASIDELKLRVQEVTGKAVKDQRLIFAGKQLEDGRTLSYYNINRESTIHLVVTLRGC